MTTQQAGAPDYFGMYEHASGRSCLGTIVRSLVQSTFGHALFIALGESGWSTQYSVNGAKEGPKGGKGIVALRTKFWQPRHQLSSPKI